MAKDRTPFHARWRDAVLAPKPDGAPGATVRLVLCAIARQVNRGTGGTFASVPYIARCAHVTDRAVQKAIKRAVAAGWLDRRPMEGGKVFLVPKLPGEPRSPANEVHPVNVEAPSGERSALGGVNHVRTNPSGEPQGTPPPGELVAAVPSAPTKRRTETPADAACRHARAVVKPGDPEGLEAAVARELEAAIAGGKIQGQSPRPYAHAIAKRLRQNPEDIDPPEVRVGPSDEARDWFTRAFALANEIAARELPLAMRLRDIAADVRDGRAEPPAETPDETLRRVRGEIQEHAA